MSNLDTSGQSRLHCRYAMPLKINPPLLHHRKLLSARGWRGVLTPFSSGQAFSFGVESERQYPFNVTAFFASLFDWRCSRANEPTTAKQKKTDFSVFLKFHDSIISRMVQKSVSICGQSVSTFVFILLSVKHLSKYRNEDIYHNAVSRLLVKLGI